MPMPVVPNQFEVGKNKIVHKPTKTTFSFDTGDTNFKSIKWGSTGEQPPKARDYRKEDVIRVAQQILDRIPR
jgi:hypothetical protein